MGDEEALETRLALLLEQTQRRVPQCPSLNVLELKAVVRQALVHKAGYRPGFGFGHMTLVRVQSEVSRTAIMAFAVRLGDEIVLGVGESDAPRPTPGIVWTELAPWRFDAEPEAIERRCASWAQVEGRREMFSLEAGRLWASDAQPRVNPATANDRANDRAGEAKPEATPEATPEAQPEARPKATPEAAKKPAKPEKKESTAPARKIEWSGALTRVQPRIRLSVVAGNEQHGYPGYVLTVDGSLGAEERAFTVGIGKAAGQKHAFAVGDRVSGVGVPVSDPTREPCELYKASKLKVTERGPASEAKPPPWVGAPPPLPDYRAKGHRPLSERAYNAECRACLWGCWMYVERAESHGAQATRGFEAMCYGPKDCFFYEEPAGESGAVS
jgi:hypothetical protein